MAKKIKVLLVCPHPDDGEVLGHQFCVQSVKAGYDVHEVLACCDEYGTLRDEFKGVRIQRIRRHEMITSAKEYGVDKDGNSLIKLHWMDYIDIHVPFSKKSVERLKRFILKIKPDYIIGPDPFVQIDGHTDHLNTGRNYYYALKAIKPEQRPRLMLFFQSTKADFFLPYLHSGIINRARLAHKSQFPPLLVKIMSKLNIMFSIFYARKTGGRYVAAYRKVVFDSKEHEVHGFKQKLLYYLIGAPIGGEEKRVRPTAKQLNLVLEPSGEIL
jgi:LmbE family N-acetylglucosaminyl deacetylase